MYWKALSSSWRTRPSSVALTVPTGSASAPISAAGRARNRQPSPTAATSASAAAKARKVRWVPAKGIRTSADEHGAEQRAGGRDRVQPPGDAARVLHVGDRQPERVGRAGAEQDHRHGNEEEDADQRADEGPRGDGVERVDRDVEERTGDERHHRQQHGRAHDQQAEAAEVRVTVADPAPEPVADRQRHQHDPDRVRPDDRGGAEERRHQPRGGDLGAEAGRPDDEDEDL